MWRGKVPFPAVLVFNFPPFAKAEPPDDVTSVADVGDLVTSFYPYRAIAADTVRRGEIPLWNPHFLSGAPFVANTQSAVFYPLNVLFYVLPLTTAWSLSFALRTFLTMVFTAMFVRSIGASVAGSVVSAVLFAFCGFMTVWQGQAMGDAAIWLPLVCFAIVRLKAVPSARWTAVLAFSLSMPVLAGHPETAMHIAITAACLALWIALPVPELRFVVCFAGAGILAIGLAAIQIVPTVEWLGLINHAFTISWPVLQPWHALGLVSRDIVGSPNTFGLHIPEQASYLAMMTFVATPLAFFHRSRRLAGFLALLAIVSLSVAYGVGPFYWIGQRLPLLKALKNHRLIFLVSFAGSVLAGLGISAMETMAVHETSTKRHRVGLLMLIGVITAGALIYVLRLVTYDMTEWLRYPRMSALFLLASAIPLLLRWLGWLNGSIFRYVVLLITCADALTFSFGYLPYVRPSDIFPHVELFDRLPKPQVEPFRLAPIGGVYGNNFESIYGMDSVAGYEMCLRRLKEFVGGLSSDHMSAVLLLADPVLAEKDRRLDMLNARYVIVSQWDPLCPRFAQQPERFRFVFSAGDSDVYENLHALPAAFLVPSSRSEFIKDSAPILKRLQDTSFDPLRSVVLERPLSLGPQSTPSSGSRSDVQWETRKSDEIMLNVDAATPSVLVLSQSFYPGWTAYVDGRRTEVFPANYVLTGIQVASGQHQVKFEFESPAFRIGLWISLTAVAVCFTLLLVSGKAH
jgi:hypothetical protein